MDAYVLLNESTAPEITPAELLRWAHALEVQNNVDFCPMWETQPKQVVVVENAQEAPAASRIFHLVDKIPEAPNALAYHTVDEHGRPVLRLGVDAIRSVGGSLVDGLTTAMSHEICETEADTYVAWMTDMPDGQSETPLECCDWTQGDSYDCQGVKVSNFNGPRFFDVAATEGPFDKMGLCTRPFELRPGGYYQKRVGGPSGTYSTVFGEACPEHVRQHAMTNSRIALRRARGLLGKTVAPQ